MSWNAVEPFGRIVRCFSLISINVVIYVAHAVETFGRIVRCFSLISINVVVAANDYSTSARGSPWGVPCLLHML